MGQKRNLRIAVISVFVIIFFVVTNTLVHYVSDYFLSEYTSSLVTSFVIGATFFLTFAGIPILFASLFIGLLTARKAHALCFLLLGFVLALLPQISGTSILSQLVIQYKPTLRLVALLFLLKIVLIFYGRRKIVHSFRKSVGKTYVFCFLLGILVSFCVTPNSFLVKVVLDEGLIQSIFVLGSFVGGFYASLFMVLRFATSLFRRRKVHVLIPPLFAFFVFFSSVLAPYVEAIVLDVYSILLILFSVAFVLILRPYVAELKNSFDEKTKTEHS